MMADMIRNDDGAAVPCHGMDGQGAVAPIGPAACRVERDLLGTADIPHDAFWGVHTSRAVANFPISGTPVGAFAELVQALAVVKQAAARTNRTLGDLDPGRAAAIEAACLRIQHDRRYHDHFVVDVMQGGAGTSTNMNANEVIANVALEIMGKPRGDYAALHPNDHVNMAQSTNDAYPTALRLAALLAVDPLVDALAALAAGLEEKAQAFSSILKVGRTQLRDAVPMTLGQEFGAFASMVRAEIRNLRAQSAAFLQVNLGGTAIGTGVNTRPGYARLVTEELARLSGHPIVSAPDFIEATSDVGAFTLFSGVLKRLALKLSKIAGDLRLLSSGPRAGLGEIVLPAVQAGSSIMPGKINPVIPEMVNQVAYLVAGHDLTITLCAEGGQLQLNPFEPMIGYCLLSSMKLLTTTVEILQSRCIAGIEADSERCRDLSENSLGVVTALVPVLGYETCSAIARRALAEGRKIADLVLEEDLLSRERLMDILRPDRLTSPNLAPVE